MFGLQQLTDDNKTLGDYGLNTNNAKAQSPATLGLVFKKEGKNVEVNPPSYGMVHTLATPN